MTTTVQNRNIPNPTLDFDSGKHIGSCRRSGCTNSFEGHGNRRFCSRLCKEKAAYFKKCNKTSAPDKVTVRTRAYLNNLEVLKRLYKTHGGNDRAIPLRNLIEQGFILFCPSDMPAMKKRGYEIQRYQDMILEINVLSQNCRILTVNEFQVPLVTKRGE
jgi:hypothetical protein